MVRPGDEQSGGECRINEDDTMLVLTRKLMERLYIGNEICVTVVRLEGGQVRLGIEAPREISVVRAELLPGGRQHAKAPESRRMTGDQEPPMPAVDGASITPRPASVPGIGSRLRGPSR
jgi:carbon storage regulator